MSDARSTRSTRTSPFLALLDRIGLGRIALRIVAVAFVALTVGCGGGGSSVPAPTIAGSVQTRSLTAHSNGSVYPLSIYLPPGSEVDRAQLPVVYLLDGESRFQTMVDSVESSRTRVIVVGIGNEAQRSRDYVPVNFCTSNGGGEAAYFDFLRLELIPYVEGNLGGDPQRRVLLGHSHGGSFVLYAMFAEPASHHTFAAYLASDASIGCMKVTVYGWEASYAASTNALPVRLHVSYSGNLDNAPFVVQLQDRHYAGLTMTAQMYAGGHIGMIPAAFADALAFAVAPSP